MSDRSRDRTPSTHADPRTAKGNRDAAALPGGFPTPRDLHLLAEGKHYRLHDRLGAHPAQVDGVNGVCFSVWAPGARRVSVVGDFNDWQGERNELKPLDRSGVWAGFVPGVGQGALYKFRIVSRKQGRAVNKSDPLAVRCEIPPRTASVVWGLGYEWGDDLWMAARGRSDPRSAPLAIYELHLGSWRRPADDPERMFGYRELAAELVPYLERMQFTHVEFLPPNEHPFYGSWGYQATGFFAATSRYGTPQDLMYLIDQLHQHGIGVILDWGPAHFPTDEHGLGFFDGTRLYEYPDPRVGYHPDWKSLIFNYGRNEVRSFLISSALFWIERYHADALRVDAVASMLYLDYSRPAGQWVANKYGGRENLEAIALLRQLNDAIHERHADVLTIAEESTTWPMVTRPTYAGGLGFDMKWDLGWMHDTLEYMSMDPIHRKFHQAKLTFRMLYAFSENFLLPLSHDEVVHGKASLLGKMWGDRWQRFAGLRALLGYMYAQPGKKLLFMGAEIGSWHEWNHDAALDWNVLADPAHAGLQRWVEDLNRVHRRRRALHEQDFDPAGFRWIDCKDVDQSVVCLTRHARGKQVVLVVCNLTPIPRHNYRIGVPADGRWEELLNSDAEVYGGSGQGNLGGVDSVPIPCHDLPHSVLLTLPPLSVTFFERRALRKRPPQE